jgi:Phosphotransferase enzyme family.
MGRAHARLSDLRHPRHGLTVLDPITFGRQHAQRISDLGDRLARLTGSIPDWEHLTFPDVPASPPLVITHGDPGPGNYLDDGDQETLIDWEEAPIAPAGSTSLGWCSSLWSAPDRAGTSYAITDRVPKQR